MVFEHKSLLELKDYELIMQLRESVFEEIRQASSDEELDQMPPAKFYLLAVSIFDMEMQNGGLCQFLLNAGRLHAPVMVEALNAFGAERHAQLFSSFCEENGIDPFNLEEFGDVSVDTFLNMYRKYPFESFDAVYMALDREMPLEGIIGSYIRANFAVFLPA